MAENQRKIHPTSMALDKVVTLPSPTNSSNPSEQSYTKSSNRPPIIERSQPPVFALARPLNRGSSGTDPVSVSRGSCFCKVICCILSVLAVLVVLFGILALVFYLTVHPKAPDYSIDQLRITDFRLNVDLSLYARFKVRVTAKNPNTKIGIYYEEGGKMSVWYTKTKLCQGSFPAFYQGPLNTTRVEVSLSGQSQYGNTLMAALQQQQQTGNIPLDLDVDQPVAIRVRSMKLGKVRFLVKCKLTVDSLSSNNLISIKASSCKIRVKL